MDKNEAYLTGRISGLAYGTTKVGKEYASFLLEQVLDDPTHVNANGKNVFKNLMRIMVFDDEPVKALRDASANEYDLVSMCAKITSRKYDKNGVSVYHINVVAKTIEVIKSQNVKEK